MIYIVQINDVQLLKLDSINNQH